MFLRIESSLRNWIFISLILITICISLLIKYLTKLCDQEKKIKNRTKTINDFNFNKELKNIDIDIILKNAINRANLLKNNFMYISQKGFNERKEFFCQDKISFFSQKFELKKLDFMNQNIKEKMMIKYMINILYYILILIGGGIFFNFFILLKLPFNLTYFSMIQQRLNFLNININYIDQLLWCLILFFSIISIFQFLNRNNNFNEQKEMMIQSFNLVNNPMNETNYENILLPERESIKFLPDCCFINNSVDKLIQIYEGRV